MNPGTWIAIYVPLIMLFFVILPQQRRARTAAFIKIRNKKRKGVIKMTNEILKKYIGKNCLISSGTLGTNVSGKIVDVNDNWIEVEVKGGNELINAEFVQSIKEIPIKKK